MHSIKTKRKSFAFYVCVFVFLFPLVFSVSLNFLCIFNKPVHFLVNLFFPPIFITGKFLWSVFCWEHTQVFVFMVSIFFFLNLCNVFWCLFYVCLKIHILWLMPSLWYDFFFLYCLCLFKFCLVGTNPVLFIVWWLYFIFAYIHLYYFFTHYHTYVYQFFCVSYFSLGVNIFQQPKIAVFHLIFI